MFNPLDYDLNREHLKELAREAEKRHSAKRWLDAFKRERKNSR